MWKWIKKKINERKEDDRRKMNLMEIWKFHLRVCMFGEPKREKSVNEQKKNCLKRKKN